MAMEQKCSRSSVASSTCSVNSKYCTVNVSLPSPGKLVVSGEQVFDIRDFDIASPTVLMLRIYPDVLVQLQVEAEPIDPAGAV